MLNQEEFKRGIVGLLDQCHCSHAEHGGVSFEGIMEILFKTISNGIAAVSGNSTDEFFRLELEMYNRLSMEMEEAFKIVERQKKLH